MSKPFYIVMAGKKQHGKDTVAAQLAQLLHNDISKPNFSIKITSFAAPLKRFCCDVFGIAEADMATEEGKQKLTSIKWQDLSRPQLIQDNYDRKTGYMTIRELLQYFGSNICRNRFYNQIWAQGPFNRTDSDVVIVTDCRFKNELEEARKNNATIFHVDRQPSPTGKDEHISEKDLDDVVWTFDETILNHGKLIDLERIVRDKYYGIVISNLKKQKPELWT